MVTPIMKINTNNSGGLLNYIEKIKIWIDWKNYHYSTTVAYPLEHSDTGIPAYNSFEIDQINADTSPIVVIDNMTESINTRKRFERYRTDRHYIIVSNGTWDTDFYKLPIRYTNLHHHFYFYEYADYVFSPYRFQFHFKNEYDFEYPKQCLFISTTGDVKHERNFFVEQLKTNICTDKFIFRYSNEEIGLPGEEFDIAKGFPGEFDAHRDIEGLEKYHHSIYVSLPIDLYNQGYFNLVLEGDIDCPNQFHPTEKIIKTLITGMPFVLVGSPLFLQHIRSLGFKTYNSLWDESYDNVFNYSDRVDKILALCNKLTTFDWQQNQTALVDIARHNRNCFLNLNVMFDQETTTVVNQLEQVARLLKK